MSESIRPRKMGLLEFVIAVSTRAGSGDWLVFCVPETEDVSAVANDVAQQLEIFTNTAVHLLEAPNDAELIVQRFKQSGPGILIVKEQERLSRLTLEDLDAARSRLVRDDAVALILRVATLKELLRSGQRRCHSRIRFRRQWIVNTESTSAMRNTDHWKRILR